jgi:hypothetical protein
MPGYRSSFFELKVLLLYYRCVLAKNERLPILGSLEIPGEGSRGKAGRNGEIKHEPYNKKTATSGRGVRSQSSMG